MVLTSGYFESRKLLRENLSDKAQILSDVANVFMKYQPIVDMVSPKDARIVSEAAIMLMQSSISYLNKAIEICKLDQEALPRQDVEKFADKVNELGLEAIHGIVQKPDETDEQFRDRFLQVQKKDQGVV